jgi:hypothetical protein
VAGIRKAVGLTTAARNVGVALVIATASFPDSAAVSAVTLRDFPDGCAGPNRSTDGPIPLSLTTSLRTERKQIHLPTRVTLHTYILFSWDFPGGLQARFAIRVVKRTFDVSYSLYSVERLRVLGGLLSTRPAFLAYRQKTGRWWTRADAASI